MLIPVLIPVLAFLGGVLLARAFGHEKARQQGHLEGYLLGYQYGRLTERLLGPCRGHKPWQPAPAILPLRAPTDRPPPAS